MGEVIMMMKNKETKNNVVLPDDGRRRGKRSYSTTWVKASLGGMRKRVTKQASQNKLWHMPEDVQVQWG
jgi:hypothetical protein